MLCLAKPSVRITQYGGCSTTYGTHRNTSFGYRLQWWSEPVGNAPENDLCIVDKSAVYSKGEALVPSEVDGPNGSAGTNAMMDGVSDSRSRILFREQNTCHSVRCLFISYVDTSFQCPLPFLAVLMSSAQDRLYVLVCMSPCTCGLLEKSMHM